MRQHHSLLYDKIAGLKLSSSQKRQFLARAVADSLAKVETNNIVDNFFNLGLLPPVKPQLRNLQVFR